jgi:hypothetical protein
MDDRSRSPWVRVTGALVGLLLFGCTPAEQPVDSSDVRAAVFEGLIAGHSGLQRAQARTFRADLRSGWAAAFDPADPPGCIVGGLNKASPRACTVYVLQRRKTRWAVVAVGRPGELTLPEGVPVDLGAPNGLGYLVD